MLIFPQSKQNHLVIFALRRRNLIVVENLIAEASDPKSSQYQRWLTTEEVRYLTNPPQSAISQVMNWLLENSVSIVSQSSNNTYITALASIDKWEILLNTTFFLCEDSLQAHARPYHRAWEYSLPRELSQHISAAFNVIEVLVNRIL
jgi:subtilase family serine protease